NRCPADAQRIGQMRFVQPFSRLEFIENRHGAQTIEDIFAPFSAYRRNGSSLHRFSNDPIDGHRDYLTFSVVLLFCMQFSILSCILNRKRVEHVQDERCRGCRKNVAVEWGQAYFWSLRGYEPALL